ncbi:MAG TPA: MerR family transcriptional regulator, partial [Bacillota bacterium]|nr:MerR family transcriptional regulator [Bacillota bacterium]
MKIGTFAQKFNLNTSTIRFYIDNGLLTPTRKGGQYSFDKECVADMEKILKYKKYYFSLEEIQLLFFLEKASRFQDEIVLEVCADMMRNKRDSLIQERDKLAQCID